MNGAGNKPMVSEHPYRHAAYLALGSALLFTVPILEAARQNTQFLNWDDFWITLLIVAGIPSLVVALLALLMPRQLSFAATLVVMVWLSANFFEISDLLRLFSIHDAYGMEFFGIVLLIPASLIGLSFLPQSLISSVIGTAGAAVFALSAGQFALALNYYYIFGPQTDPIALLDPAPLPPLGEVEQPLPDIIFIVPDRYANLRVLHEDFGHDNTGFLSDLRERGFAIAEEARANYLKTRYSLASSMNMQYLEPVLSRLAPVTDSALPLYSLIENNLVVDRLKSLGYQYVHVGSSWDGTRNSALADVSVDFGPSYFGGELGAAVARRHLLVLLLSTAERPDGCALLKRQLSFLETAGGDKRPTFVFAHVLAPHDPILTDGEGNCIPPVLYHPPDVTWQDFKSAYSGYVTYLNQRLLKIFDRQVADNPNSLIFVVQADEGPFPKSYRDSLLDPDREMDWRKASSSDLAMKFGLMNALYLGDPEKFVGLPEVPNTLSPVNNWRIIFGRIEDRQYPLLTNRQFIFPTENEPYISIEITDKLKGDSLKTKRNFYQNSVLQDK